MSFIQRFLLGNRVTDDLKVGLFLKNDGTVWVRNPDGSSFPISAAEVGNFSSASFQIAVPGDQPDLALTVPINTGGTSPVTVTSAPVIFGMGDAVPFEYLGATPFDGTATILQFTLSYFATNADGSEVLYLVNSNDIAFTYGVTPPLPASADDWTIQGQTGDDLSIGSDGSLVSTGGGVYFLSAGMRISLA